MIKTLPLAASILATLLAEFYLLRAVRRMATDRAQIHARLNTLDDASTLDPAELKQLYIGLAHHHFCSALPVLALVLFGLIPLFAGLFWTFFSVIRGYIKYSKLFFALVFCVVALAGRLDHRRNQRRLLQVQNDGGKACPNCLYSLHGLKAVSRCPECGIFIRLDLVRRIWDDRFKG